MRLGVKVAELNRRGDLLVTYGHSWTPGETHVDCVDFETGEDVAITINPGTRYVRWENMVHVVVLFTKFVFSPLCIHRQQR